MAAPAIVRADSLMKLWVPEVEFILPDMRNRFLTSDHTVDAFRYSLAVARVWHKETMNNFDFFSGYQFKKVTTR